METYRAISFQKNKTFPLRMKGYDEAEVSDDKMNSANK